MLGVAHHRLGFGQVLRMAALLRYLKLGLGGGPVNKAGAAKDDHRVFNTGFGLGQIRLEHFQLKANAPGFAAQQKFGVGKSQSMSLGLQPLTQLGLRLQVGPSMRKRSVFQVLSALHRADCAPATRHATRNAITHEKSPLWGFHGGLDRKIRRACGIRQCGCRFRSCRLGSRTKALALPCRWRSWRA